MRRLLIQFYIFLLFAVVGLGWSLEQVWRDKQPQTPEWVAPFSEAIAFSANRLGNAEQVSELFGLEVIILPLNSVAWPEQEQQRLAAGETIALFNSMQQIYLYQQRQNSAGSSELWRVGPIGEPVAAPTYWYHVLYFILLALLASFWIWPLTRDLRLLERHLGELPQQQDQRFTLSKRSLIQPLAISFNTMRSQIKHLLSLQRELTRAVSHDLRTPLARMKFSLAMRAEKGDNVDMLQEDVAEMEQLVGTLLDYAKLEGQENVLHVSTVNITELAINLTEKLNQMPGPAVQVKSPQELQLAGDGHYLERALQNLILNARRHAKSNVQVTLEARKERVYIHIDDDGMGVATHERSRILQPFVRLEESRSKASGGVGLGLTIVARIVEWHHGQLRIDTSPFGGARFSLILPVKHTAARQEHIH